MAVSVGTIQLTLSIAIMQVPTSVAICRFWGSIAIVLVVLSAIPMLVNPFCFAVTTVTVSVAIM